MDKYRPELDTCPCCGVRGCCKIHGYYKRRIGEFSDGTVIWEKVRVMRVMCCSSGHTHAILPDVIIPYSRHGIIFILRALASHFIQHLPAEKPVNCTASAGTSSSGGSPCGGNIRISGSGG